MISRLEDIIKQAHDFYGRLSKLKDELSTYTVEGDAGGGMIKVYADGLGRILRVEIEPEIVNIDEQEMLQDLIVAAVNQALDVSKEKASELTRRLTGGVYIPGMEDLLTTLPVK
jgi:hypothetical protein